MALVYCDDVGRNEDNKVNWVPPPPPLLPTQFQCGAKLHSPATGLRSPGFPGAAAIAPLPRGWAHRAGRRPAARLPWNGEGEEENAGKEINNKESVCGGEKGGGGGRTLQKTPACWKALVSEGRCRCGHPGSPQPFQAGAAWERPPPAHSPARGLGLRCWQRTPLLPHWLARWIGTHCSWTVLDLCLYVCSNVCLKHNHPWQESMLPCDTAYSIDRCSLPHTTQFSILNSLGICKSRIN